MWVWWRMLDNFSSYGASNHLSEVLDYVQHWRDRVSNEEVRARGQTLSTVGIDINELIFDCGSKGTVNFRTWDFGGQVSGEWRNWAVIHCSPTDQLQCLLWYFSVWMLHNTPILPVSCNVFCGTFQRECYTTPQNVLSVTISSAMLFSMNTIHLTDTSCQLRCLLQYPSVRILTHQYFLSVTISFVVLFSMKATQHTKTSCQLQYLLRYLSAWTLRSIPKLPVSCNIFCGTFQSEYYATHQYFLSPRSLYLVMWSIIEGGRGVEGLQQWLINIQVISSTGVGFGIWTSFSFFLFLSFFLYSISLSLVWILGHLTWVRHSSCKSGATHSCQCVPCFLCPNNGMAASVWDF